MGQEIFTHCPLVEASRETYKINWRIIKISIRDFSGGTVVNSPPAEAGDTGSVPDPGRSHVPRSH